MATTELVAPFPKLRFVDSNGNALSGGKLFTYTGGTTTKANTYTDSTGGTANANPIILDSRGECNCWIPPNTNFKFVLSPSTDTDPPTNAIWTVDNVSSNLPATSIIPCTATGTNTIALTPASSTVTAYSDQQFFSFYAAATNTGATTLNVSSLGAKNLYLSDGATAAGANVLVSGQFYTAAYSAAANSNAGGFILQAPLLVSAANSFKGNNTGSKAETADLTVLQALNLLVSGGALRGFIDGFETSAPGGAQTLTIGPGSALDNTNANWMSVTSSYTKTMAAWAVGSGNGGLDTGAAASSTAYFVWIIQRTDTGVVDYLISTSGTTPTLPTNYTVSRGPVAWFKTDGSSNIPKYQQRGDEFIFGTSVADQNPATVGTSASLLTVTVPSGFQVNVTFRGSILLAGGPTSVIFTSPDESDQAAGVPQNDIAATTNVTTSGRFNIRTNTSAQIRARCGAASTSVYIGTYGFIWTRGRNS